jgi:hypothetical protein
MKKYLVVFFVLALALMLSSCEGKEEAGFSDDYQNACFDIGGLMSPDGCVLQQKVAVNTDCETEDTSVENPIVSAASDCKARAKEIGAPDEIVSAICDAEPSGNGVSMRLPVGTKVQIGTITFDAEDRVWVLQDFTVPSIASYAFEYAGAEQALFDAPFVVGSELGYGENGERVPFKICFSVDGDCTPPINLFPTQ